MKNILETAPTPFVSAYYFIIMNTGVIYLSILYGRNAATFVPMCHVINIAIVKQYNGEFYKLRKNPQ